MSMEAALEKNTEALLKVADLLEASNNGRDVALAKLEASIADGKGTAGRPRGSKNKDSGAEAPQTVTAATPPPPSTTVPTEDDLRNAAVKFTNVAEADKPARKEFLKAVNDYLGIGKIMEAQEGDRAQIIAWFDLKAAGKEVEFPTGDDAGADEPEPDDIG